MSGKSAVARAGRIVVVPLVLVAVLRRVSRRRAATGRGPGAAGGEAAGVREPRNPLPTVLSGAAAAVPGE